MPEEKETHESYGLIRISRGHSNNTTLFGSPVQHRTVMSLEIHQASVSQNRGYRHLQTEELIFQGDLSPQQLTEMLLLANTHPGVPITIRYVSGDPESKRENPPPHHEAERLARQARQRLAQPLEQLRQLRERTRNQKNGQELDAIIDRFQETLPSLERELAEYIQQVAHAARIDAAARATPSPEVP